jgi:hypothetical protein
MSFGVLNTCTPYTCVGVYVPPWVPDEVVAHLTEEARAKLQANDEIELAHRGWPIFTPIVPPPEWDAARQQNALDYMKLVAENGARRHAGLTHSSAYSPWQSDMVPITNCDWGAPGVTQGRGPWAWHGVQAMQNKLAFGSGWVISCGMLKDAGLVNTADECLREREAAAAEFAKCREKASDPGTGRKVAAIATQVLTAVVGLAVGMLGWAGLPYTIAGILQQVNEGKLKGSSAAQKIGLAIGSAIPYVGWIVSVVSASISVAETLEQREKTQAALKARREALEGKMRELAELIDARATIAEMTAKAKELEALTIAAQEEMYGREKTLLAVGLGIVALFMLTRRG